MPSGSPMTNRGCGVRPPYSMRDGDRPLAVVAMPHRVRGNSRSPRSQIAYAANSRSRSRYSRSSTRSAVLRATSDPREPTATVAITAPAMGIVPDAAAPRAAGGGGGDAARGGRPPLRGPAPAPRPPATRRRSTPSSVTIAVTSAAGTRSWTRVADRRPLGRDARAADAERPAPAGPPRARPRRRRRGPGRRAVVGATR